VTAVAILEIRAARPDLRFVGRLALFAVAWTIALVLVANWILSSGGMPDARAYWSAWQGGLYGVTPALNRSAYFYPPPFAQALWPLTLLPWSAFAALWMAAYAATLWWLLQPVRFALRVPLLLVFLLSSSNAAVLVAVAIVSRRSWAWAFPILTKITPGVGLLWYAVRREWYALGIALGVTALLAAVSFAASPDLWARWIAAILADSGHQGGLVAPLLPQVPLWARLTASATLVVWGARTERGWTLAVAALLANPDVMLSSLPLLAAVPRLQCTPAPEPSRYLSGRFERSLAHGPHLSWSSRSLS